MSVVYKFRWPLGIVALWIGSLVLCVQLVDAAPLSQDADAMLRVINMSEETICSVLISPFTSDDEVGNNWLSEEETILPGESHDFNLTAGDYNIHLNDCEGNTLFIRSKLAVSNLYELRFDDADLCGILNQQGGTFLFQAQYQDALRKFQDALTCYREADDRSGEATSLNNLGILYFSLGKHPDAFDHAQQALTIRREIGDRAAEGAVLGNIAVFHYDLGENAEALECYKQALTIWREIGDRPKEAKSLHEIGYIYIRLGQYPQALDYVQQALAIWRGMGDRAGEANELNSIGRIRDAQGQYAEALDYVQQALTIRREIDDREGIGESLNDIGYIYTHIGQYVEALDYFQEALTIWQELGNRSGKAASLNYIGFSYGQLGRYAEALDYTQKALDIRREIGVPRDVGDSLNNVAGIYYYLGQYEQALDYLQHALDLMQESGDRAGETFSLNGIGFIYLQLGQYSKALDYFQKTLIVAREIGDRPREGDSLNNIGVIYDEALGQSLKALVYYQQALVIYKEIGNRSGERISLDNIATAYVDLGQYAEALDYYEQVLEIGREIGARAGESITLNNIGRVYAKRGQYVEALNHYEQALRIQRETGDQTGQGTILNNIGDTYTLMGQPTQALDAYQQAITAIEKLRGEMSTEELKSDLAAENARPYNGMIQTLLQLQRPEDAFHYVQRAKARTFLDQIGNVRVNPRSTDTPELLEREQALLSEIRTLEAVLSGQQDFNTLDANTRGGAPHTLTPEQQIEVQDKLHHAYRDYEHLLTQIKLNNPAYAALRTVDVSTLITVQQRLPADVTLVEYHILSSTQTLAFVVAQDSFHTVPISISVQSLRENIADLRNFTSLGAVPQSAQLLYDALFAPVREHIHTHSLLIAPHLHLHYLPFSALHDGERYLVEDYIIGYIPSASVLPYINLSGSPPRDGSVLILGNPDNETVTPLPGAENEARALAKLFDVSPYLEGEATEARLWEQAGEASYIHIAAHGSFNPIAPQFSRLYLAPDEAPESASAEHHDGLLEVREVWNLPLDNANLVTLSACQTQLGDLSAGDELVGLSRAFLYAGTPTLVASLWSVNDVSTAFLMEHFYGYLKDGMGKAAALQQAQLDTMEKYPSPYYWAAFTLIGDMGGETTPLFQSRLRLSTGNVLLFALMGLGLIGSASYLWWVKRQRVLAQRALLTQLEALLTTRQRLKAEPETPERARALKYIAHKLREIGQQYPQDSRSKRHYDQK